MDSWVPWIASWYPIAPLSRRSREVILTILFENPLELRLAVLNYQIKQIMLKYI